MTLKANLGAIALFFAWGFVMHAAGLLLHELGGHALASLIFGCGFDGLVLTFFGHGQVHLTRCFRWTEITILVADWSGLLLTTAAGVGAALFARTRRLPPIARLLVALVAFFFLLGQLGYATSGGFHDLYDPGRTARRLGARGVHPLAWVPPLLAYAAASVLCARSAVEAFREHFGACSRRQTVTFLARTLGVAGALYFMAYRVEWKLRTDLAMRGVEVEAARVAMARHAEPPFPIELVLLAIGLGAVVLALARPVASARDASGTGGAAIPRGVVAIVSGATVFFALLLTVLQRA